MIKNSCLHYLQAWVVKVARLVRKNFQHRSYPPLPGEVLPLIPPPPSEGELFLRFRQAVKCRQFKKPSLPQKWLFSKSLE